MVRSSRKSARFSDRITLLTDFIWARTSCIKACILYLFRSADSMILVRQRLLFDEEDVVGWRGELLGLLFG